MQLSKYEAGLIKVLRDWHRLSDKRHLAISSTSHGFLIEVSTADGDLSELQCALLGFGTTLDEAMANMYSPSRPV